MNKEVVVRLLKDHIREICQRFSVERLCLFGSVVRGDSVDKSDVDVWWYLDKKRPLIASWT